MRKADLSVLDEVLDRVATATRRILEQGPAAAMNEFNRERRHGGEQQDQADKNRERLTTVNCLAVSGINRCGGKGISMSRVYEVMFIVRPDVDDEEAEKLIAGFSSTVTSGGGVVKSGREDGPPQAGLHGA